MYSGKKSYDEGTYCMSVVQTEKQINKEER